MIRYLAYLFLLFLPVYSWGQLFNFKPINASAVAQLEEGQHSTKQEYDYFITVAPDYFPNRKKFALAQPIVYVYPPSGSFDYEVSYFYSKKDSVVRLTEYHWEGTDSSGYKEFNAIVAGNKKFMTRYFKKSGKHIPATKTKGAKTIWENEFVHVEQFYSPGLLRISVLISWK